MHDLLHGVASVATEFKVFEFRLSIIGARLEQSHPLQPAPRAPLIAEAEPMLEEFPESVAKR